MENQKTNIIRSPMGEYIRVYIYGVIGEIEDYIEIIATIRDSSENDIIKVFLNTPGGNLNTALSIVKAMNESRGHIITVIDGECISAGTLIFLSGREYEISEDCAFMIHTYSNGMFGKGHELDSQIAFEKQWFIKLAKRFYKDFLTEEEIQKIIDGKDLWMDSEEVAIRCLNIIDSKNSEVDEETE